jgi:RNA 3'-terminal phosphate cyclase (ATP)
VTVLRIDGAQGEGGGQILRTALALSAVTGRPFEAVNIRANRPKPGLRPQHLEAVRAAARVCSAQVEGAAENSSDLRFTPGPVAHGRFRFEIRTAGSAPLVLQTVYLPLCLAAGESTVEIRGGTHVPFSPCYHYLEGQWAPWVGRLGFAVEPRLLRCGFYPAGGGEMQARIRPVELLAGLRLAARGALKELRLLSAACNLPAHIAERQARRVRERLARLDLDRDPVVETPEVPAEGKGTFCVLTACFEHGAAVYAALGAVGKPAEKVGDEAGRALADFIRSEATVDEYLADQLLLPAACVPGETEYLTPCVTGHLLTNAQIIRAFLPADILIEGDAGAPGRVRVRGLDPRRLTGG